MTGNEKDMLLHRIPVHLRVVSSRGLFGRRGSSKEERREERREERQEMYVRLQENLQEQGIINVSSPLKLNYVVMVC